MMLTTSVSSSPAWASLSHLTASSYCRFSIRHWNHSGRVRLVKLAQFILAHTFTCPVPHSHLTPPPPHLPSTYMCMTYTWLTPLCPPPPHPPHPLPIHTRIRRLTIHTTHTWHSMLHIRMHAFYTCHHHHSHPPLNTHTHTPRKMALPSMNLTNLWEWWWRRWW